MLDVRKNVAGSPCWPSAGIVDARAFRVGNSCTVHTLACGVTAHVVERDGRLASWAYDLADCQTCKRAER